MLSPLIAKFFAIDGRAITIERWMKQRNYTKILSKEDPEQYLY